eukprot:598242-Amphidinium_carterae.1
MVFTLVWMCLSCTSKSTSVLDRVVWQRFYSTRMLGAALQVSMQVFCQQLLITIPGFGMYMTHPSFTCVTPLSRLEAPLASGLLSITSMEVVASCCQLALLASRYHAWQSRLRAGGTGAIVLRQSILRTTSHIARWFLLLASCLIFAVPGALYSSVKDVPGLFASVMHEEGKYELLLHIIPLLNSFATAIVLPQVIRSAGRACLLPVREEECVAISRLLSA